MKTTSDERVYSIVMTKIKINMQMKGTGRNPIINFFDFW